MMNDVEVQLPAFYAVIPANVRYDKKLPHGAKLLFGEITALCSKEGYCWASNNYFAKLYDCGNTTISAWIQKLIAAGYIRVKVQPEKGNLRLIYLNTEKNQEKLDFESKTTIQNNDIGSKPLEDLSIKTEDLSKPLEDLSIKLKDINTCINTSINTSSSWRNSTDPPDKPEFQNPGNAAGSSLFEIIPRLYRHWFNKIDPHPIADVNAVGKLLMQYEELGFELLEKIADRAFERVVQEKQKKDWVTREVIFRIKWGIEDYHKASVKAEAKKKKEELNSIVVDSKATAQIFRNVIEEIKTKPVIETNVDQDKLRRKSKFQQALRVERGLHDSF